MLPKLLVIVGPTASGKTALSIELAKKFGGEVISADSRQVFRGMDIGTAKPDRESLPEQTEGPISIHSMVAGGKPVLVEGVPHWGFDLAEPDEEFAVSQFKDYAISRINDITRRGKLPMLVGGTGLWIDALLDNLTFAEVPPDPKLRVELEARHIDDLFAEYKRLDPDGAEVIDRHNKRRLVRALEVTKKTGKPFSALREKGPQLFDALVIGLSVPREELNQRLDERVDEMIGRGLVNEVRALKDKYGCEANAMTGIGYRQICFFLDGKANLAAAIEDVKRDTRAYAKRQMTWFNKNKNVRWIENPADAFGLVEAFL
jgi:tRNA dimethylallyltransferase